MVFKRKTATNFTHENVRAVEGGHPRQARREGNFSFHKWDKKWTTGKMGSKIKNR